MRRSHRLPAALLVVGALALVGCERPSPTASPPARAVATTPDLTPIAPTQIHDVLAARRGKVVLVNVWASWCMPCREEFPDLIRAYRELQPRGLELVLISADFEAQREKARTFLAGQGVDFPTYLKTGPDGPFIDAVDSGWSGSIPATLVLGRDGVKKAFWDGAASYEEFKKAVEPLL